VTPALRAHVMQKGNIGGSGIWTILPMWACHHDHLFVGLWIRGLTLVMGFAFLSAACVMPSYARRRSRRRAHGGQPGGQLRMQLSPHNFV